MANDLTLSVKLTGDGRQLSGTLKDAQGDVREFSATTERESRKADSALEKPARQATTVSDHLRGAQQEARAFGTETTRGGNQAVQALTQTSREAQTTTAHLDKMRGVIVGAGTALVAAFGAGSIINRAGLINDADALAKSIGIATGELQAWDYAAQRTGLSGGAIGDIFKDVSDKLGDFAATGGGEAADLFENLNLQIGELQRLSPDQQLLKIADAISQIEDPSQRIFYLESLANDATRLLPLLQDNAAGLRELTDEAYAMGVAMDQVDIDNALDADRAMAQLRGTTEGFLNLLAADLGPVMASTVGEFTDFIQEAGGADEVLSNLTDTALILATLIAGRYVGAIAASKAALTAKAAIAATTTGTLNLLTGATSRQTVANNVMAASARGAAGAIALVGGPAGAAVVAVGALYYFREELGFVDVAAQDATDALDANSAAIHSGTAAAMDASYDNLISSLEAVSLQAQEAMTQLMELEARKAFYENSHQGVAESVSGAIDNQAQVLEGLWARQVELRTAIKENRAARESATVSDRAANVVMSDMTVTADALTKSTTRKTVATREAAKEATTLAASYENLLDRLNPNRRAARQYTQDLGVLNLAFATGRMSAVQYMQAMGLLHESFQEAQRDSEELATTVGAEADRMATLYKRQLERMDDAAVDMHRSFLTGAEDAFGSFKRLAIDTLAEVIHAYTTRQITASIGVNTSGGGMPGAAPGGGFGISPGSIGNAWNAVQNGFGNIQWGGAGGAQAYGGSGWLSAANTQTGLWGGSMQNFSGMQGLAGAGAGFAGSYAGTQIGESLFGKKAGSSYGATGGALIGTYFGGPLGSAIGGAIGGALDAAFGSGKSDPRLNISTYGDRSSFSHDSVATGAFGTVGFGKGTRRSDELFGGIPEEREFLAAVAASDNLVASLARTPDELDRMAGAVQGVHLSASGVDGIMEQLSKRTVAAISALDGDFGEFVASLGTDVDTIVARTQNAVAALNLMGGASERLNLQFDVSAQGALRAADNIAQFAGGVDQLNQLQTSYYQSYFSDAERAANLQHDLTQTLGQMGYTLPATHEGFRALVEQQDRMTESGQRQYVQLLQLAGGFDELQTMLARTGETASVTTEALRSAQDVARERERLERQKLTLEGNTLELRRRDLEALDESNRPLQQHIWTLQDEADAAKAAERALTDMSRETERAASALMGGVQNAYKALTQSISNEQAILRSAYDETTQRINANISTIQDAISASERTARSLSSTLDTMMQRELGQAESRRDAQSYLQSVLASGGLGDPAMLDKALTAVSEPSEGLYGSFEAYQRDFWTTANVIDQLNDRADGQLTTEQRSLAALERQLATAERQFQREMNQLDDILDAESKQLEAIFGQQSWLEKIDGSVLSLGDALKALSVATGSAVASGSGGGAGATQSRHSNASIKQSADDIAARTVGGWNEKDSAIGRAAIAAGVSSAQLAASLGTSQQYVLDRAQQLGLPKFRDGGIASGPDSGYPVELHGREAVIPLKNGPIPLQITGGGDAELLREIRRLNDRIARLEVELKEGNSISRGIADHTSKAAREAERQRHERQQEALA